MSVRAAAWTRYALRLGIGLGLVALLAWRADLAQLGASLRRFDAAPFALALALFFLACALAALRWKLLLAEVGYGQLLRYSFVGQFYAMVLPGQIAGEAMKAYRIAASGVDGARVAASVLLDRLVGTLGLVLIALAGLAMSSQAVARAVAPVFGVVVAGLLLAFIVVAVPATARLGIAVLRSSRWPAPLRRPAGMVAGMVDALHAFSGSRLRLAASLAIGVVFQVFVVAIYAGLAASIGIQIAWVDWLWIVAVASIAVLLPLSIGGLGLREGALVGCLAAFAVPPAPAVALSLAIFAIMAVGAALGGVLELVGDKQGAAA